MDFVFPATDVRRVRFLDRQKEVCKDCANSQKRFGDSCYCTLYGIIIGYSKTECKGWKHEEIPAEHSESTNEVHGD